MNLFRRETQNREELDELQVSRDLLDNDFKTFPVRLLHFEQDQTDVVFSLQLFPTLKSRDCMLYNDFDDDRHFYPVVKPLKQSQDLCRKVVAPDIIGSDSGILHSCNLSIEEHQKNLYAMTDYLHEMFEHISYFRDKRVPIELIEDPFKRIIIEIHLPFLKKEGVFWEAARREHKELGELFLDISRVYSELSDELTESKVKESVGSDSPQLKEQLELFNSISSISHQIGDKHNHLSSLT